MRLIEEDEVVIGKTELEKNFISNYQNINYDLNILNNSNEDFFKRIGKHLNKKGFSRERSYEAGYAFYSMASSIDVRGTYFLLSSINKSLSPLYKALINYPVLNLVNPKALKSSHIFSSVLQMFDDYMNQKIVETIYKFHQSVFYKKGTIEFRDEWHFSKIEVDFLQYQILLNVIIIRKNNLYPFKEDFIHYGELKDRSLINAKINQAAFFKRMFEIVYENIIFIFQTISR